MAEDRLKRPVFAPIIAGASLVALVAVLIFYALAAAETHTAVCTLRDNLVQQQAESRHFLTLTQAERRARYGAIGNIPDSTLRSSLNNRQHTIDALSGLHC